MAKTGVGRWHFQQSAWLQESRIGPLSRSFVPMGDTIPADSRTANLYPALTGSQRLRPAGAIPRTYRLGHLAVVRPSTG